MGFRDMGCYKRDSPPFPGERPRRGAPLRHLTAARSPNGERARWRGPRAAPPARSLRRRSGARSRRCGAQREREEKEMTLGFARPAEAWFCSAGNVAQPSDRDERLTLTGPTFSPGGFSLSRPRPRLWPRARDAPSASGPLGCFFVSGRMAACGGERNPRASGPQADFGFGPSAGRGRGIVSREVGRGLISVSGWFPGGRAR
jgi:hypothetical protein